jgi:hypothetical protein
MGTGSSVYVPRGLKSRWFFTDQRSRADPDLGAVTRIRVRAVSGREVSTHGMPCVSERDPASGLQILTLEGLAELMACIQAWACPVTISPPEGDLPWELELEDGLHAAGAAPPPEDDDEP